MAAKNLMLDSPLQIDEPPRISPSKPSSTTHNSPVELVRGIGRWDLVGLVINGVIGAGIFGLPSTTFKHANTYSLFALFACAVFASLIILCFAEVSSRFTETGGPYLYAREALGEQAGFVIGWLMWLTRILSFASICNLLVTYVAHFWPAAEANPWRPVLIVLIVLALTIINLVGVREAAVTSNFFAVAKLVPLFLFVVIGCFHLRAGNFAFGSPPRADEFSTAVLLLVFAFGGFETATVAAGEVREPQRNFPFALCFAMAVVVAFYLGIQIVCVGTLPGLATSSRPLADAATQFLGPAGGAAIVLGAVISMAGVLNAALLAGGRLPFAMAEHGTLPGFFATIHPRFHTPHVAILVTAGIVLVITLTSTFISAAAISILTRLAIYACTCVCLFVLRRRSGGQPAGFTVPGSVIIPVAALALCAWLLWHSSWRDVRDISIAAAIGLGLYFLNSMWRKRRE
jgi:amino acid transporter